MSVTPSSDATAKVWVEFNDPDGNRILLETVGSLPANQFRMEFQQGVTAHSRARGILDDDRFMSSSGPTHADVTLKFRVKNDSPSQAGYIFGNREDVIHHPEHVGIPMYRPAGSSSSSIEDRLGLASEPTGDQDEGACDCARGKVLAHAAATAGGRR
jgi:hypothetical protein